MPHILIDARESGTSTGRYIDKLIEHLHQLHMQSPADAQHQFTLAAKPHRIAYLQQIAPSFTSTAADFKEFTFKQEQLAFGRWLKQQHADLVHFGKDHQPLLYRGKTVTTMHDLTTMRFTNPDKPLPIYKFKQVVYKQVVKVVAKKSQHIITPTQFVKDDLIKYTGVPADKITVTYEAAEPITEEATPLATLQNKRFIMYVGRPTPHKNLQRLIAAFQELQGSRSEYSDLYLVLAGKLDNNYKKIQQKTQSEQIANIIYTDFITDGQLRWLYENCQAYVFPSLSEGFGLPGLEAMVHGAPVISSNATCLPEVYGDAAHYFDPRNTQDMASAINQVLSNERLRTQLINRGIDQAAQYSWQRMAEQTLDIYNQALSKQ